MKICLIGMGIAVLLLIIYIVIALVSLIGKSIEHQNTEVGNHMLEDAAGNIETMMTSESDEKSESDKIMEKLEDFAARNDFSVEEYPVEMIELLEKNSEAEEFVLYYPLKKGNYSTSPLNSYLNSIQTPLFLQWDSKWGYYEYGDKPMGITGCGPTCLSMVALHLLQNPQMTPIYVAEFAERNGFYVEGTGTAWTLMTQGAAEFGLYAQEVTLDEDVVMRHLSQGKPIICVMGPGDFTETGHFIVFVGIEDGKIRVNDPNSKIRSEKLWAFEDIKYQIKNMWVYSVQ
ncbi:MAG: C39 family peptidase [Agathobacter sp.]|nr:C39 family peptidase [Agathobacter sp.]